MTGIATLNHARFTKKATIFVIILAARRIKMNNEDTQCGECGKKISDKFYMIPEEFFDSDIWRTNETVTSRG